MSNLIIVESPTKSKTISKFLGSGFLVRSSMGHVRDLPKSTMGIDIERDFKPKYIIPAKAKSVIKELKEAMARSDKVILASVDHDEPILIKCPDSTIRQFKSGHFIDTAIDQKMDLNNFQVPAFDFSTRKISFKPIKAVSRHPVSERLLELSLEYGRKLKITASHSVFSQDKNGDIQTVAGGSLKPGDSILVPVKMPQNQSNIAKVDLLKEVYLDNELRHQVFIKSPLVRNYRLEKIMSPKTGTTPQFQPRFIFKKDFLSELKTKRLELGLSQNALAATIKTSQSNICEWEGGKANLTLGLAKRYLGTLGLNFRTITESGAGLIAPSSIEVAIQNAIQNQWNDSRKSLSRTWQPLDWFNWEEIETHFAKDTELEISRHNHLHSMPRHIEVGEDLMLFLGFFIAEGSYLTHGRHVRFSFGKRSVGNEAQNIETVKTVAKKLFNATASDFEDKSSNSVIINSSLVAFLLKNVLGINGTAHTKTVPWLAFSSPHNLQFAFLKGLFLGDGSLGEQNIVFNTVSEPLAQGIRFLLLQNGILTSHHVSISKKPNRKPFHHISICGKERLVATKAIWSAHYKAGKLLNYISKPGLTKKGWSLIKNESDDLGMLKVLSIKETRPSGNFVYDFSVEGENFICGTGGVCAHNTDEDREGEAIAWHLAEALGLGISNFQFPISKKNQKPETRNQKPVQRIVFHEITKSAIEEALKHPRSIDYNLVDAQQARRVLDRLVGYELSPFLWKKIRYGLSAGRVQSVALRLVVEREREIQNFAKQEYWSVEVDLSKNKGDKKIRARLIKIGEQAVGKLDIKNQAEAEKIVSDLSDAEYRVADVNHKEVVRNPSPPFTTSTLQQEASRKFGMSAKQTMMIAQQLYETGYITYMRTDSHNLAQFALDQAKTIITEHFGKDYALGEPRRYTTKSKGAQEAHEAIRPTDLSQRPEILKGDSLDSRQFKLYDLIWKRTIASQMQQAVFDQTAVDIRANNFIFRANGQVVKFDGFIRAYTEGKDEKDEDEIEGVLPELESGETLSLIEIFKLQHFTEPPPRYSDATLIKTLEAHGVGRPSTYAPTLATIQERDYVEKIDRRYFKPTEIGFLVNDMLVENFPEIVDINFTSHIEEQFDDIAEGKIKWVPVIEEFYAPFKKNLDEKSASVEKLVETSSTPCQHCGKMMIIKFGRTGKFLACPEPGSKITQPLPEEAAQIKELEEKTRGEKCPICGKSMAVKRGRFGYFLGCSDYPKCKGIAKIFNKTGFKCPNCLALRSLGGEGLIGDIVERKSRGRGRIFYACSRFPECNFLTGKKPESEEELKRALEEWKANPPRLKKSKK